MSSTPRSPAILWYSGDWLRDPGVRSLSFAARGLWIDMLNLMCQSDRKGYLLLAGKPVTAEQLARMTGGSTDEVSRLLTELESSGVFSRTEFGVIYSRRIVRDERERELTRQRVARHRRRSSPLRNGICNANDTEKKRQCTEDEDEETGLGGAGGRGSPVTRSNLPCDNPGLVPAAKRVVRFYQQTVRPAHAQAANAVENVIACLNGGASEQCLCDAATRYSRWCSGMEKKAQHRLSVANFYAAHGAYEEYLQPDSPNWTAMSPEEIWNSTKAMEPREKKAIYDQLPKETVEQIHKIRRAEMELQNS